MTTSHHNSSAIVQASFVARDHKILDLDFPDESRRFGDLIKTELVDSKAQSIEIDVRGCVVLYSSASSFLRPAIDHLLSLTAPDRQLRILTSLHYDSEEITMYEIFRGCDFLVGRTNSKSIVPALSSYCAEKKILLTVEAEAPRGGGRKAKTEYKYGI